MRAHKRFDKRGFTLVELMIVVAIVGILATLAIVGYSKLTAASKTAEAKTNVGAIADAAVAAYNRESAKNEMLGDKASSVVATHELCGDAAPVPATVPKNTKYQPSTQPNQDFHAGDAATGWACLRFSIANPVFYQYGYVRGVGTGVGSATATGFEASAVGDVDGNGVNSTFARGADIRNGQVVLSSKIAVQNETE